MQKFIEYVAVSTYKKNPGLLIVSSEKKVPGFKCSMPNEGITPRLLPGYNMDILSKFVVLIVFYTFDS